MKAAKFASSKTKLAACLGLSRQYLYAFFALPDSPRPGSNGMHNVLTWRKFIAARSRRVKGAATEREALQVAYLRARVEREQLELSELDNSIRSSITNEISGEACRIIDCLTGEIRRMPHQFSGVFAGKTPNQICKLWQRELDQSFLKAGNALEKIRATSRRKTAERKKEETNVVPFRAAGGN